LRFASLCCTEQINLRELSLPNAIKILENMDRSGDGPVILRFLYGDAVLDEDKEEDPLMDMFEAMTTPDEVRAGTLTD
jgi:hypothetical protein